MRISPINQVVTIHEATRIFGLERSAIRKAIKRGALPARKSSETWLIDVAELLRYKKYGGFFFENVPDELKPAFERVMKAAHE